MDRSNLGNARLQGLPQDTLGGDPTGELFDWVNSAFFFSYVSAMLLLSFCGMLKPNADLMSNTRNYCFQVIPTTVMARMCCYWMGPVFNTHGIRSMDYATCFD